MRQSFPLQTMYFTVAVTNRSHCGCVVFLSVCAWTHFWSAMRSTPLGINKTIDLITATNTEPHLTVSDSVRKWRVDKSVAKKCSFWFSTHWQFSQEDQRGLTAQEHVCLIVFLALTTFFSKYTWMITTRHLILEFHPLIHS